MESNHLSADHVLSLAQSMYPAEIDALVQLACGETSPSPSATRLAHSVDTSTSHPNLTLDSCPPLYESMTSPTPIIHHNHMTPESQCHMTPTMTPDGHMTFTFDGTPPSSPSQWEDYRFQVDLELAETVLRSEAQLTIKQEPCESAYSPVSLPDHDDATHERLEADSSTPLKFRLRDENRKQRRREQNRRAAKKCRLKKQAQHEALVEEYRRLESSNNDLQAKLDSLQCETSRLRELLRKHMTTCTLTFSTTV